MNPAANTAYQAAACGLRGCKATTRVFLAEVTNDPRRRGWWTTICAVCGDQGFWRPEGA